MPVLPFLHAVKKLNKIYPHFISSPLKIIAPFTIHVPVIYFGKKLKYSILISPAIISMFVYKFHLLPHCSYA